MIKVIKLNNRNFLYRKDNPSEIVTRWSPDDLVLRIELDDGSILKVNNDQISVKYGGTISFDYNDDKYIVDDGYQNMLIKAGYVVKDKYDTEHEYDKEKGLEIRNALMETVFASVNKFVFNNPEISSCGWDKGYVLNVECDGFLYTFVFDYVSCIVVKNQQRKINDITFYPFSKKMDKYGTLYLATFCQKLQDNVDNNKKYANADNIIREIISDMNNKSESYYHYSAVPVDKRICRWAGI